MKLPILNGIQYRTVSNVKDDTARTAYKGNTEKTAPMSAEHPRFGRLADTLAADDEQLSPLQRRRQLPTGSVALAGPQRRRPQAACGTTTSQLPPKTPQAVHAMDAGANVLLHGLGATYYEDINLLQSHLASEGYCTFSLT